MYKEAFRKAPPAVRKIIEEFRRIPLKIRENLVLLYYILRGNTADYKMSQKDANVKKQPINGQMCGNCKYWYPQPLRNKYACAQVRGSYIMGWFWCKLWKGNIKFAWTKWKPVVRKNEESNFCGC